MHTFAFYNIGHYNIGHLARFRHGGRQGNGHKIANFDIWVLIQGILKSGDQGVQHIKKHFFLPWTPTYTLNPAVTFPF